jgi:PAS domain S-box-containing protein
VSVVALGSCAGGLGAIQAMLAKLPSDCGMAFVVIQHLDPARRSVLRGLRSTRSPFPVLEISNGIALQPNHVYVVPPNKKASIHNGTLSLGAINCHGACQPIDDFMADLAATRGDEAIGVVLSGLGSDGTRGLAAIKVTNGITFAQDPQTTKWPDMPRCAIKAGCVDFVLSPAGIALELGRLGRYAESKVRRAQQQSMRQRENELAALFDSSPDPHLRYDSNLRITHANPAWGKAVGLSPRSAIGKTNGELALPLAEARVGNRSIAAGHSRQSVIGTTNGQLALPLAEARVGDRLIREVFQTGQPQRYEFSVPSSQGLAAHEVRFVPEFSPDGSVAAVLAIGRDITELKRIEQELRQREQELVELYDNSPDPIARRDRNLRNTYVNAAWERLMGIPRKKALGKTIEELELPQATVKLQKRVIRQVLKTRRPMTAEFGHPSRGGFAYEVRHIPEFVGGNVVSFLLIGRDVTEQKRLQRLAAANERDIRALSASLITAQEQERRRVAREIHDSLCQHLGALAAGLGVVAAELPASSPARQHLQAARQRAIRAAEEAREIARQLHPAILEDLGLPKALQNLCREASQRQGIPVKFRVTKRLPEVAIEDASCVYRIAQEALNNAAKHADPKNIWVRLSGTRNVRLSIQDDGIGFDADSVRGSGGLGLVSMKERARTAGATLSIQGRPGHGTQVNLVVPIRGETREKSAYSARR